jgi:CheY-like chemotaxis protein
VEQKQLQDIHVLIVEDHDDTREILEHYLRHHGAIVTVAASGRDALTLLQHVTPHVIVSDITMPGMTGVDLIRAIRALPGQTERPTPAIAVTAHSYHLRRAALEAGFDVFLVKPVDPLTVVSYVAALYERAGLEGHTGPRQPREPHEGPFDSPTPSEE